MEVNGQSFEGGDGLSEELLSDFPSATSSASSAAVGESSGLAATAIADYEATEDDQVGG